METLESLKRELEEFTPKRFNTVYCSLIDVAQTSDREYEVLNALSFIASCNLMLEQVNETLKNIPNEGMAKQPDETHCPMCEAKEKTIQISQQIISHMEERLQLKDDIITSLKKSEDEAMKALNSITGKNLKVCK